LIEVGGKVRLVKGAYKENEKYAFQSNVEIKLNYIKLLEMLFRYSNSKWKNSKVDIKKFKFQFLKGIRDELKICLVEKRFRVGEYIPYGKNWLHYSIRRLTERKRNIFLLARSLVGS